VPAPNEESKAAADRAEEAFRALVAARPGSAAAHAGLGIARARCLIPHAGMASIMNVVESATHSLRAALELDPAHWEARFTLAMVYFNMPAFLNKTADAIRELEVLRAQQGGSHDRPHYGLVWLRLGDAYKRAGRAADAQAAYAAGAKLFPANAELQQKAAESGAPRGTTTSSDSPPANASPPVFALSPLRVEAAGAQLEEARGSASLRRMDVYLMPGWTGELHPERRRRAHQHLVGDARQAVHVAGRVQLRLPERCSGVM
jgi:tetratricopeptide (TPR) repeat protein